MHNVRLAILILLAPLLPWRAASGQGFTPKEALGRMKVPDGFEVSLFASEPEIRQPLSISFDERGRMWVIQYLQYPAPAGLKSVKVDQYLRTTYDRVPEPPPKGPRGADRITICEDTDGDGRADKFKDFITGLNLTTGLALGHGGVFVLQAPYLLFYPDRNRDDVPDGDPEVLLSGFGMEDAHALANSLQWGPDGWLYGAQGSTVTANIRGIEFQQGIWRYHPLTRQFELFAEGGGNTWGLDFDAHGNIIAGTNFGDDIGLHQVQGAYYVKNFGKHGELHNPYAFGYFGHIPYKGFKGGHVTSGGIIYQGDSFPAEYRNQYIAGNLLANALYWHVLEPQGSSFKGHFGGDFLISNDTWFRPVDCLTGPDGSLFVADWYDKRATHVDSKDTWDRSNGRIYKIAANGTKKIEPFDLHRLSNAALVQMLDHPNEWFAAEARQILAERRDQSLAPTLLENVFASGNTHRALESLWAFYVTKGISDLDGQTVERLLRHSNVDVRAWTVRLLGDAREIRQDIAGLFPALCRSEESPIVRNQLACTAKRVEGRLAISMLAELFGHNEDVTDLQIPLLLWWALENKAISNRSEVLEYFHHPENWRFPLVQQYILERIGRRYAATGTFEDTKSCAELISNAPSAESFNHLISGIGIGLQGQTLTEERRSPLLKSIGKHWEEDVWSYSLLGLGLRLIQSNSFEKAFAYAENIRNPESERAALIEVLGETQSKSSIPLLLKFCAREYPSKIQIAAISALQHFPDPEIGERFLEKLNGASPEMQNRLKNALCTRPIWAEKLLQAVGEGKIAPQSISLEQLRQIRRMHTASLDTLVAKRWGKVGEQSSLEKVSFLNKVKLLLKPSGVAGRDGKGDPKEGKRIFKQTCEICHTLFDEGNTIGPNLTGADRNNLDYMLVSIINPSDFIRVEYASFEIETKDDRVLSGLIVDSSPQAVTLLDRNNQRTVLPRDQIRKLNESSVSLMPEGLLEALKEQEIMDLFTYLQSDKPPSTK